MTQRRLERRQDTNLVHPPYPATIDNVALRDKQMLDANPWGGTCYHRPGYIGRRCGSGLRKGKLSGPLYT